MPSIFVGQRGSIVRICCAIALALAAVAAFGGRAHAWAEDITVCVANDAAAQWQLIAAESLAGEMFKGIGVHVVWSHRHGGAAAMVHIVDWRAGHPSDQLAYAEPFAAPPGRVVILFRNVKAVAVREPLVTKLLGHVLCHELTHLLSGVDAHSPEGVMKARWIARDLQQMAHAPLHFMSCDALRVHSAQERAGARVGEAAPVASEH